MGSALLARQTDVERFEGVTHVQGDLTLTGEVSDLSPLHCLRTVSGELGILGTTALVDTTGLEGLTSVGTVYCSERCADYNFRTGCVNNERLESVRLNGLLSASIFISNGNPALREVAFDALTEAAGITIFDTSLEEISRFDALESLGSFFVSDSALVRIAGFAGITTLESFDVSCPLVEDIDAFAELSHASHFLIEAPLLTNLQAFAHLETVDELELSHVGLADLTAFSGLTSVGTLTLTSDPALTTLAGLEGVTHLTELELSFSPVEDLRALDAVVGDVAFVGVRATALADLSALPLASSVEYFRIEDNAVLTSVGALDMPLINTLSLDRNPKLADLSGLAGRANVVNLSISGSEALTSLHDLADQTNISNLVISNNPNLPTCEAEWLRDYLGVEVAGIGGNDDAGTCP